MPKVTLPILIHTKVWYTAHSGAYNSIFGPFLISQAPSTPVCWGLPHVHLDIFFLSLSWVPKFLLHIFSWDAWRCLNILKSKPSMHAQLKTNSSNNSYNQACSSSYITSYCSTRCFKLKTPDLSPGDPSHSSQMFLLAFRHTVIADFKHSSIFLRRLLSGDS